jgi:hypothetical protein
MRCFSRRPLSITDLADLEIYYKSSDYYREDAKVYTGKDAAISILNKSITPFNRFSSRASNFTYILDSNYSQLNGQLVVPYTKLGDMSKGAVSFYNVDKKGNETKITSFRTTAGDEPVQVSMDLSGVEILKIYTYDYENSYDTMSGAFYNVTLTGIK